LGRLDQVYARLPVWAQHAAVSAYGVYWNRLRFGRGFEQFVSEYSQRDRFSQQQWNEWQHARLRELLQLAATHVPYYRDTWTQAQKAAAREGRLAELPLLEKAPLRADARAFLRDDARARKELVFHTSGSTGTPIAAIWTVSEYRNALALREVRSARWAGVSFRDPRATFSGRIVVPDPNSPGPFYRYNIAERQVYLSAFHLRRDTAPAYVEALRKHRVQWMTGYAVSYYLLARFILEDKIPVPPIKAIVTTSEKVTSAMRATMQEAFRCRVFEEYSTVENAVFASECDHGRLHVSPDAGVVELLRPDGTPCEPGEPGEVVATCLMRDYQPMIRFRLGDMAVWDSEPCPCGRSMPVIKEVLGRVEDVIVGPDGRQMVRFHGIFVDQPHVREGQIIQEAINRIRVKVVPTDGFGPSDTANIIQRIHQRLTDQVQVIVETVDAIPRTKAGKYQAVVSLLREQGEHAAETTGIDA
jgi:phenylacetate-CoA ligase